MFVRTARICRWHTSLMLRTADSDGNAWSIIRVEHEMLSAHEMFFRKKLVALRTDAWREGIGARI